MDFDGQNGYRYIKCLKVSLKPFLRLVGLGARLLPVAGKRSATREKTRSITTVRERDDYVFEWAGATPR